MQHTFKSYPHNLASLAAGRPFDVRKVDALRPAVEIGDTVRFVDTRDPENGLTKKVAFVLRGDGAALPFDHFAMAFDVAADLTASFQKSCARLLDAGFRMRHAGRDDHRDRSRAGASRPPAFLEGRRSARRPYPGDFKRTRNGAVDDNRRQREALINHAQRQICKPSDEAKNGPTKPSSSCSGYATLGAQSLCRTTSRASRVRYLHRDNHRRTPRSRPFS
jgi:hypothetical protein